MSEHAAAAHAAQHRWNVYGALGSVTTERPAWRHADATAHPEGHVPLDAAESIERRAEGGAQRLAGGGGVDGGYRPALRGDLHLFERRLEHQPHRLAGLRRA